MHHTLHVLDDPALINPTLDWATPQRPCNSELNRHFFTVTNQPRINISSSYNDCLDISWSDLRYCSQSIQGQNESTKRGSSFDFSTADLASFGIPLTNFVPLDRSALNRFVFVTAASGGFFYIAMDAIGNVQRHFPNQSIYFYDLDENRPQDQIIKVGLRVLATGK